VKYKRAQRGIEVDPTDPPKKKITKQSVFEDTKKIFKKEFPNVAIPDSIVRDYSMVYLLSGLRKDALNKMIEKERKRQQG